MKSIQKVVLACALQVGAIGVPMFVGSLQAAQAQEAATCSTRSRSVFDQRLLQKSDRGEEALRRYVERTQAVRKVDLPAAQARIARLRRERDVCDVPLTGGQ